MAKQTRKTAAPTADDWRKVLDAYKRDRVFDTSDFRENAHRFVPALKDESDRAYNTAARIARQDPADLLEHDGAAVILNLERKGYTEQLRLADLDLLRLKPIEPWLREADPYGVIPDVPRPLDVLHDVTAEELVGISRRHAAHVERWGLGVTTQRPVQLLRLQAERILEGRARAQSRIAYYESQQEAIKPATLVALYDLFNAVESWKAETIEIAKQLVDAGIPSKRTAGQGDLVTPPKSARERAARVRTWASNLRQRRLEWEEWKAQRKIRP